MVKWGNFWVTLPGEKINKRTYPEKHCVSAFRVFVMEAITVGILEAGILSLERAQDFL